MTFNVRTAHGTIHSMTDGRTYRLYDMTVTNEAGRVTGKADCGAHTSGAAKLTDEPVTCAKCISKR